MKYSLLCLVILFCSPSTAQKKTFALGFDYVHYALPRSWQGDKNVKTELYEDEASSVLRRAAVWLSVNSDNKFSLRLYAQPFSQQAAYRPLDLMPAGFVNERQALLCDLTFGYNFLDPDFDKLSAWGYLGLCFPPASGSESRITYVPGWIDVYGTSRSIEGIFPSAQVLIKYKLVPHLFFGVGGTYRYIFRNFQPVSGNISLSAEF